VAHQKRKWRMGQSESRQERKWQSCETDASLTLSGTKISGKIATLHVTPPRRNRLTVPGLFCADSIFG
jgi:hypothetical protein